MQAANLRPFLIRVLKALTSIHLGTLTCEPPPPASLCPCHIQPHTITQGWVEFRDEKVGGLGTMEGRRKVAGTWERKPSIRQGGPYLKTGATRWDQRKKEKTPSPHRFVFLIEMWVHIRQVQRHRRRSQAKSVCPDGDFSLTAPLVLCCYSHPSQDSCRNVSKHFFSCRRGGRGWGWRVRGPPPGQQPQCSCGGGCGRAKESAESRLTARGVAQRGS